MNQFDGGRRIGGPPRAGGRDTTRVGNRYVYLIRHAWYDGSDPRDERIGKGIDSLGRAQSRYTAERLAAWPFKVDRLVSSTFTRARETADVIGEALHMPAVRDSEISECTPPSNRPDYGQDQGPGDDIRCKEALENGQPLRALGLTGIDERRLRGFQSLSAKPLLLVINLDEADASSAASVADAAARTGLSAFLSRAATRAVPVCAKIELEIAALEPADAQAFLADLGLHESGLDRVIRASYDLLGYISFFTVGEDECRAWAIPKGSTAPQGAGQIHTDLEHGFVRAEVVHYEDFTKHGSMKEAKHHGVYRLEGKTYVVHDGDIMHILAST